MRIQLDRHIGHVWPRLTLTFDSGETSLWTAPDPDLGGPATEDTVFRPGDYVGPPERPPLTAGDIDAIGVERENGERRTAQYYVRRFD